MPLKAAARGRRHRSLRRRPLTFSPFARSIAVAASNKKPKREIPESKLQTDNFSSSSGNGFLNHKKAKIEYSESSDSEDFDGIVQADFAFFDPKPSDFHGVKVLLQMYLDNKQWDLGGFVDLILEQPTVGSVVKIENDEDDGVYSVISALNFGRYSGSKCMTEIKDYLLKFCKDKDTVAKLKTTLEENADKLGLIVSQRVVNLPHQLLPPLYDALFDEIEWATEDEPTEELRNSFCFKCFLVISKIYKHKNVELVKGSSKGGEEAIIYIKPEDEILMELSAWSFSFQLQVQQVATDELKNYRLMGLVICIEASKVRMFRQQLHSLIDDNNES